MSTMLPVTQATETAVSEFDEWSNQLHKYANQTSILRKWHYFLLFTCITSAIIKRVTHSTYNVQAALATT